MSSYWHPEQPNTDHPTTPNNRLGQLRAAVALAHSVCGADIMLGLDDGATMTVGTCPHHDLHPCRLRATVVHDLRRCSPQGFTQICSVKVCGSLTEIGPGMYNDQSGYRIYFTTALAPGLVETAAQALHNEFSAPDSIEVAIQPDSQLCMTTVCVSSTTQHELGTARDIAGQLAGQCMATTMANTL